MVLQIKGFCPDLDLIYVTTLIPENETAEREPILASSTKEKK